MILDIVGIYQLFIDKSRVPNYDIQVGYSLYSMLILNVDMQILMLSIYFIFKLQVSSMESVYTESSIISSMKTSNFN